MCPLINYMIAWKTRRSRKWSSVQLARDSWQSSYLFNPGYITKIFVQLQRCWLLFKEKVNSKRKRTNKRASCGVGSTGGKLLGLYKQWKLQKLVDQWTSKLLTKSPKITLEKNMQTGCAFSGGKKKKKSCCNQNRLSKEKSPRRQGWSKACRKVLRGKNWPSATSPDWRTDCQGVPNLLLSARLLVHSPFLYPKVFTVQPKREWSSGQIPKEFPCADNAVQQFRNSLWY